MTDRRNFITGLALAPIIAAAPAMAMTATPSPDPVRGLTRCENAPE